MSSFQRYLGLRIGYTLVSMVAISVIVFAISQILPGNAAHVILGQNAQPENVAVLEEQLGLNRPVYIQYLDWMGGILQGDWGQSLIFGQPVVDVLIPRLVKSLQLALITLFLVILVGIPLGVLAAVSRSGVLDFLITGPTYVGISVPAYVTGTILLLLFAGPVFQLLPSGQFVPISEGIIPWATHLVLPTVTLMTILVAHVMRQTRSSMVDVLQSDYVRTARLKGMGETKVILKHALRNGLLPTITVLALDFGYLMGSIVVVEEVFAYPGIGRLVIRAIHNRDLPVIQMSVLVIAIAYTLANLVADITYSYLDPRIEIGGDR